MAVRGDPEPGGLVRIQWAMLGVVCLLVLVFASVSALEPTYEIRVSSAGVERSRTPAGLVFARTLAPLVIWPVLTAAIVRLAAARPLAPTAQSAGIHLAAAFAAGLAYALVSWTLHTTLFDPTEFHRDLPATVRRELPSGLLFYGAILGTAVALLHGRGSEAKAADEPSPRESGEAAVAPLDRLMVGGGRRRIALPVEEIDWIGASGPYCEIRAGQDTHLLRMSLAALEGRLDPSRFVRVHRSTIVNLQRVRELRERRRGDYSLVLQDGTELNVSRGRRPVLAERLAPN